MSIFSLDDEMRRCLEPWDGSTWFVEQPEDFVKGIYTLSQYQAHYILKRAVGLTRWEAETAQRAYYSDKPAGPGLRFWLDRIERDKCPEVLA
ncbi:MAG: hypothetical protein AAF697_13070 [Pseudomonadota bacterium]